MIAVGIRWLSALLLSLTVLLTGAWSLRPAPGPPAAGPSPTTPSGALQEVAPPLAVQQLQALLEAREPQLRILSPADETTLPAGPWDLEVELSDWPLVGPGPLGIGPHLVVQLDQQDPLRVSDPRSDGLVPLRLRLPMAPLAPGSHRLSVYAAKPWGEAVKSAGGFRQIRLHRAVANPLELPAAGSPQLISAIPFDLATAQPVLIDWLLVEAPLQRLRHDDRRWLLRVTVNGDSFLVDRQTTIWLKGLRQGGNALQLELLDGLGEPLNPPYNSLVQEVTLTGAASNSGNRWLQETLTPLEIGQILGLAVEPEPEPAALQPDPDGQGAAGAPQDQEWPLWEPLPGEPLQGEPSQEDPPQADSDAPAGTGEADDIGLVIGAAADANPSDLQDPAEPGQRSAPDSQGQDPEPRTDRGAGAEAAPDPPDVSVSR